MCVYIYLTLLRVQLNFTHNIECQPTKLPFLALKKLLVFPMNTQEPSTYHFNTCIWNMLLNYGISLIQCYVFTRFAKVLFLSVTNMAAWITILLTDQKNLLWREGVVCRDVSGPDIGIGINSSIR